MTLSRRIADALDDLAATGGATSGSVVAEAPPHRLELTIRTASPIGVEADRLDFKARPEDAPDLVLGDLQAWADRLTARVTYLMEPLVLVEADAEGTTVELRSQKPTPRDGHRSYYEVLLDRGGRLRLHRVRVENSDRRRSEAPFQLSREVLERLADDLVATAPA